MAPPRTVYNVLATEYFSTHDLMFLDRPGLKGKCSVTQTRVSTSEALLYPTRARLVPDLVGTMICRMTLGHMADEGAGVQCMLVIHCRLVQWEMGKSKGVSITESFCINYRVGALIP
jgi:hypothetical protein